MQTPKLLPLIVAAAIVLPAAVNASGTYTSRPPRPPVRGDGGERLDSARYDLGKRIYTGKATLTTAGAAAGQEARLRTLQGRLPAKEQRKVDLTALSGKLNAEQLDALEYYVAHRFPQK